MDDTRPHQSDHYDESREMKFKETPGNGLSANGSSNDFKGPRTLTNRQGHIVADNQNIRTVGSRGPSTLENYNFLEKITHFDRERIPERVASRPAGVPTVSSKPTVPSAVNPFPATPGPSSSKNGANARRCSFVSPR